MKKRGQSSIITIVLIILITMVAIIIFWNVVRGIIKEQSEDIDTGALTVNMEIDKQKSTLIPLSISIERNAGEGNVTGMKFVIEDVNGNRDTYTKYITINELETKKIEIPLTDLTKLDSAVSYVEIYPIFKTASGKEKIGIMQDSMGESEAGGTPGVCAGIDTSCGTYPACENCNLQDGCDATDYKDYFCVSNACDSNIITQVESIANNNCQDTLDNDCDGNIDNADSSCTCPNGVCLPGEICSADNSYCNTPPILPPVCYITPGVCASGCRYGTITSGQTDLNRCDASHTYGSCTSVPCECDGEGNCVSAFAPPWISDTGITNGLAYGGGYSAPTVFKIGTEFYLISGDGDGTFNGYKWSVTSNNWGPSLTIISGLPTGKTYARPKAFYINNILYLIYTASSGQYGAYQWTGSTWATASSWLTTGLTLSDYQVPAYFEKDSQKYLIVGKRNGFDGYRLSGGNWVADTAITQGLSDLYPGTANDIPAPEVFYIGSTLYLIAGETDGGFFGFKWDGQKWVAEAGPGSIVEGLTVFSQSYPTIFYKDSRLYLISGKLDGLFQGWKIE